jgi:amino acid adenylation domain-containing protein
MDKKEIKMIKKDDVKDMYFLSPMQEGMLFHYIMDKESTVYFEQMTFSINGELYIELFKKAFAHLIDRHDILRTIFIYEKVERPVQVVLKKMNASIYYDDISDFDENEKVKRINDFKIKNKTRGFDLSKDILIRFSIFKIAKQRYEIIWSFHHIIMDGWSISILTQEILRLYHHLKKGGMLHLSPSPPYKNYIRWIEKQDKQKALTYWKNYLQDYEEPAFIAGRIPGKEMKYESREYRFFLDKGLTRALERISNENRVTINTIFQVLWGILLQKYNNTNDVVFGVVVSGRSAELEDIETSVGLFINTIPVRIKNEPGDSWGKLLEKVQNNMIQLQLYEFVSLVDIQSNSSLKRELINHIVDFGNYPVYSEIKKLNQASGMDFSVESVDTFEQTNYDMTVIVLAGEELQVNLIYNPLVYPPDVVRRLEAHLVLIIEQVVGNSKIPVEKIGILTGVEKNRILFDFNNTQANYPISTCIQELFEKQVERVPERIALIGSSQLAVGKEGRGHSQPIKGRMEDGGAAPWVRPYTGHLQLTYREFNEKSNQLARVLRGKGIKPDTIVGIMIKRSIEMIIGMLGILKSGGAYLPIDPAFPGERIKYMLTDSKTKFLLAAPETQVKDEVEAGFLEIIDISNPSSLSPSSTTCQVNPANLAYVIYTSGSTGRPKGVMVQHGSVVNILLALFKKYPLLKKDTYLLKTTYTFDVSVSELFGWYLGGGRLAILEPGGEKDPLTILDWIERIGVTHINFVPSVFGVFLEILDPRKISQLSNLKYIFLAGEALTPYLVTRFNQFHTGIILENIYGPTESTIYTSQYSLLAWPGVGSIPIGKPLSNIRLYILNPSDQLQPIGVLGELYIGGDGLARGYLNRPGLTAEKFIEWVTGAGDRCRWEATSNKKFLRGSGVVFIKRAPGHRRQRIYKTGDLCRWLSDGNIEFLGRIDRQVKIRGFRIELEEIESQLLEHKNIAQAVVVAKADGKGDKYLCAYIESYNEHAASELREYLANVLPGYMIPSYFIYLEKIPITSNGKIDRNALPDPELNKGEEHIAPRDNIEEKLVKIWAEVLGIQKDVISIDSNFFELGGHSLKASMMVVRIHKELEVKVPLNNVFKTPTIKGLSRFIKASEKNNYAILKLVEKKEYYTSSLTQKRFYIMQKLDPGNISYNLSLALIMEGDLGEKRLEKVFNRLSRRHQAFRTSFELIADQLVQKVYDQVEMVIQCYEGTEEKVKDIIQNFIKPFNLDNAPLMRIGLIKLQKARHILIVDMHHIANDGLSFVILLREFAALYQDRHLAPLHLQYTDFSEWQNTQGERERIEKQSEFWFKQFEGEVPVLKLPTDYPRPSVQDFAGGTTAFEIAVEKTKVLKELVLDEGTSLFIVLFAIYNILLAKLAGQLDIIIGTGVANRGHADLINIIGLFFNSIPLRNRLELEKPFTRFLKELKENTLEAFNNQEYPIDMLVEDLLNRGLITRDASRNPLFDTMFAMQNFWESTESINQFQIPGLKLREYLFERKTSRFDLFLYGIEQQGTILMHLEYANALFKQSTVQKMTDYYEEILEQVLENKDIKIEDISIGGDLLEIHSNAAQNEYINFEF